MVIASVLNMKTASSKAPPNENYCSSSMNNNFHSVLEDLKEGVFIFDDQFKLIFCNSSIKRFLNKVDISAEIGMSYIQICSHFLDLNEIKDSFSRRQDGEVLLSKNSYNYLIEKLTIHHSFLGIILKFSFSNNQIFLSNGIALQPSGMWSERFELCMQFTSRLRLKIVDVSSNFNLFFASGTPKKMSLNTLIHSLDLGSLLSKLRSQFNKNKSFQTELRIYTDQNKSEWFRVVIWRIEGDRIKGVFEKIDLEKRTELEKVQLIEDALREERNRIALDLHDGISQNLVAIKMFLGSDQIISNSFENIKYQKLLDDTLNEIKQIVSNLTFYDFSEGLTTGLSKYFEHLNAHSNDIHFVFLNDSIAEKKLNIDTVNIVFRIIQEFVMNTQKHSKGTLFSCIVSGGKNKMKLILKDNGVGFNVKDVKKGFGFNNMSKQASVLKVEFKCKSKKGEGTELTLVL